MKPLFILLFSLILTVCNAQRSYKIDHIATRQYIPEIDRFEVWTDWEEVDATAIFNITKMEVVIVYSEGRHRYSILKIGNLEEKQGKETVLLYCLDRDDIKCVIELVHYEEKGEQMYIRWQNVEVVYQMRQL